MHIKPFRAVIPRLDYITAIDSFFNAIKEEYNDYHVSGFFKAADREALYIYQIEKKGRTHHGLIACSEIQDFLEGNIRKHEHTLAAKEQKQMQLMLRRKAAVKPVLLTYPEVPSIKDFLEKYPRKKTPILDVYFESEKAHHKLWEVSDKDAIVQIQELFELHVPYTYIADGHHRTSTTAMMYHRHLEGKLVGDYHLLLCAYFPTSEIEIQAFNRVITGFGDLSPVNFMARLSKFAEIDILEGAEKPRCKHEVTMLIAREWYRLRWKESVLLEYADEAATLDAAILDDKVLKGLLGIEDVRTDLRIKYVEGPKGLKGVAKHARKSDETVAFCLYPTQMEEVLKLADADKVLPPKSTWFEPRMKNGLIVQEFEK